MTEKTLIIATNDPDSDVSQYHELGNLVNTSWLAVQETSPRFDNYKNWVNVQVYIIPMWEWDKVVAAVSISTPSLLHTCSYSDLVCYQF